MLKPVGCTTLILNFYMLATLEDACHCTPVRSWLRIQSFMGQILFVAVPAVYAY